MKREPKSKQAIVISFAAAGVSAVIAALGLHGNHRLIVLGIDSAIILVAAFYIRRRVRDAAMREPSVPAE